jgi:hypothetical protein
MKAQRGQRSNRLVVLLFITALVTMAMMGSESSPFSSSSSCLFATAFVGRQQGQHQHNSVYQRQKVSFGFVSAVRFSSSLGVPKERKLFAASYAKAKDDDDKTTKQRYGLEVRKVKRERNMQRRKERAERKDYSETEVAQTTRTNSVANKITTTGGRIVALLSFPFRRILSMITGLFNYFRKVKSI